MTWQINAYQCIRHKIRQKVSNRGGILEFLSNCKMKTKNSWNGVKHVIHRINNEDGGMFTIFKLRLAPRYFTLANASQL